MRFRIEKIKAQAKIRLLLGLEGKEMISQTLGPLLFVDAGRFSCFPRKIQSERRAPLLLRLRASEHGCHHQGGTYQNYREPKPEENFKKEVVHDATPSLRFRSQRTYSRFHESL